MSWENYSLMKCKKCGHLYEVEESSLIINETRYDKCPLCNSDGEFLSNRSILDVMNEQRENFKIRKNNKNMLKR